MSNINIDISPNLFNENFEPFFKAKTRYLHTYGGAGSGKSFNCAWKVIIKTLKNKNYNWLLTRKVARTIRNSQFRLIKDLLFNYSTGLNTLFTIRESEMSFKCINGNEILSSGADDIEKLKSVHNISAIWAEEATEFSREDLMQLDLRMRGDSPDYQQMVCSYNPSDINSHLKSDYHDNVHEDATVLWSTYKDNKFILKNKQYIQQLENYEKIDIAFYKIYTLGEWAVLKGLIYPNFIISREFPTTQKAYGLDFGFEHPNALTQLQLSENKLYCKSIIYESNLTIQDLIDKMNLLNVSKTDIILADGSRPEAIEQIRRAGFNIRAAVKGSGSVLEGIMNVKKYDLVFHSESIELKNEALTYKWKTDNLGNPITPEQPVKFKDDAMDSIRYGVQYFGKQQINIRVW